MGKICYRLVFPKSKVFIRSWDVHFSDSLPAVYSESRMVELKWLWTAPCAAAGINNNKFQWTGSNGGGFKFQEEIILKKSK